MQTVEQASIILNASAAATAWLNAFLATGQNDDQPVLYRTLSVEFFREGVQFIGCDGTMLFRTWVPKHQTDAEFPEEFEVPDRAVVVMDAEHFAQGFIRTLLSATKGIDYAELSLSVEPAPETDEAPLGAAFSEDVLTIRALGQQLHCRLFEQDYVNWRELRFGIDRADRVDGMKISTRMFAALGKLKAVGAIECTFTGDEKHILVSGEANSFRGIIMPMRRKEKEKPEPDEPDDDSEQTDALDENTLHVHAKAGVEGTKVKLNGEWVDATEENMRKAVAPVVEELQRKVKRAKAERAQSDALATSGASE